MKINIRVVLGLLAVLGACAKERPIEKKSDVNDPRWKKSILTNTSGAEQNALGLTDQGSNAKKWLHKITMVKTTAGAGIGFVGLQNSMKLGYFEFTKEKLNFYNAISLYNQDQATAPELVNSWPIEHSEYRLAESGGKTTNVEEENNYVGWENKGYFRINFKEMDLNFELANMECWRRLSTNLVDGSESVTEDHVAFTVSVHYELTENCYNYANIRRLLNDNLTASIELRYSFKPEKDSAYIPYRYNGEEDPLNMKYGYFQTKIEKLNQFGRVENNFLMNRWDPSKTHTIYFAPGFPEEHKWIYAKEEQGVIARTNALMARNGLPTRFRVEDAPAGVTFGDVGVSFFKYIGEMDEGAPLGYGPSDAHPLTGEIIASNAMVWTGYLGYYMERIGDEVSRDKERFSRSTLYQKMKGLLNNASATDADPTGKYMDEWVKTAQTLKADENANGIFYFLLPQFTYGLPGNLYALSPQAKGQAHSEFEALLEEKIFDFSSMNRTQNILDGIGVDKNIAKLLPRAEGYAKDYFRSALQVRHDYHQSTVYDLEASLAQATGALANGDSPEQVLRTILYRVAIHEFGHNLGLRHNFYGSVDAHHFAEPIPAVDAKGNPIMENVTDELGNQVTRQKMLSQNSSSVMDYADLTDEMHDRWDWEAYDEAALVYAYSNGGVDFTRKYNTTYLYCTDEHRVINAMCGAWDRGTTPSEVALSLVKRYEANYWVRNYRYDRAYWNSEAYASAIFQDMWNLKKFLTLMEQTFDNDEIRKRLKKSVWGSYDEKTTNEITRVIRSDFKQAVKLSAAFYHGVIQQSFVDRPWTDVYSEFSGALQRKGILWDKLFAMFFLMGDDGFIYNINNAVAPATYLLYKNDGEIGEVISKIVSQSLLRHIDMEQGFNSFARVLYAVNSYNYRSRDNAEFIEKIRFTCLTPETLKEKMGIDPENFTSEALKNGQVLDTAVIDWDGMKAEKVDPYFASSREKLAITRIGGNYYAALQLKNEYAFDLVESIVNSTASVVTEKSEMTELYNIYHLITQSRVPECR